MLPCWAVLVAVGASCRPAPPHARVDPDAPHAEASAAHGPRWPSVELADDPWAWPGPHCLAYSQRLASYACVSLDATPTKASGEDLSSPSMLETLALVRRRGAHVKLGVALVSAHGRQTHVVLDTEPSPTTNVEPLVDVRRELVRRGYTAPITTRARLEPNTWVPVGGVELRYSVRLHEGDASFEYYGKLEIRCTPDGPAQAVAFDPNDPIGGPSAVVSSATGASLHALTVEHEDGGEGWVSVAWSSWLVDEAQWCPAR